MNGDLLVEEQTVTADDQGMWTYAFTVPKYNADGTEAVYSIQELPVKGFRTTYNGYNITNTYIPPVRVEFPGITKIIEGENIPEAEFRFVLKGTPGAPMPENADGYYAWCYVTGAGQTSFEDITFTEAGEYSYLVFESDEKQLGWDYDPAIYTVTFTVTEDEAELSCQYDIVRNYNTANEIVFVNSYEEIDLTEMITVQGEKIWNHGDNPIESRPEYVIVQIYGNNLLLHELTVTEVDNWQYSVEVQKYDEYGDEIVYTVDEAEVENYSKIINGYILINTYVPPDNPPPPDTTDKPEDPEPSSPIDKPEDPEPSSPVDKPEDPEPSSPVDIPEVTPKPGTVTPSPSRPPSEPEDVPKTGDESNLPLWFCIMVVSIIGLFYTLWVGTSRERGLHKRRR